jgi:hypothetical protein
MRDLAFHQKFPLNRNRLASLIRCIRDSQTITKKAASSCMGVGEPAAEGSLGWLVKSGLGTSQKGVYGLSPFGMLVAEHDPELNHPGTLWLLHYYLVSEHEERAEVWYRTFNEFLAPGVRFTRPQLQVYMERSLEPTATNKSYIDEDSRKFVSAYTEPTALSKLDLVHKVEKDTYEVGLNSLPGPQIFAFALFDAWQRRFPHADTLRITQIYEEPEMPGKVFAVRRDQIVQLLQVLQSLGLVNIVDSQHEPVTRRFRDEPYQLIANFYASL